MNTAFSSQIAAAVALALSLPAFGCSEQTCTQAEHRLAVRAEPAGAFVSSDPTSVCAAVCKVAGARMRGDVALANCRLTEPLGPEGVAAAQCTLLEASCTDYADYSIGFGKGRRPDGFAWPKATGASIGACLAADAALELASVTAFRDLACSLVAYGAPRELVQRARRAAREELQHTRIMQALAARYGAVANPQLPKRRAPANLRELALLNAREGCVMETFGALEVMALATSATDPEVRAAMQRIGPEEVAHAKLSRDVHAWVLTQADSALAAELASTLKSAKAELLAHLLAAAPASHAMRAGVALKPAQQRALYRAAGQDWAFV